MMGTTASTIGAFNSEKGFPCDLRLCSHEELDDIIRYVAANSPWNSIPESCEPDDDEDPSTIRSFEEIQSHMNRHGLRLITGVEYAAELKARDERGASAVIPLWVPINGHVRQSKHRRFCGI